MKKANSNFKLMAMQVQHYTHSNPKNPKDPRTHHTPEYNPSTEKNHMLHFRTRGTNQSWWIFPPRNKIQHTDTINAPQKRPSTCRMQHNKECYGISHGSIIGKIISKLPESDSHKKVPNRNGPPTTTHNGGNGQYSGKQHRKWKGKTKKSRAIDMIFYWYRYIIRQNHFHIFW